jgi:hypothetical protein
VRELPPLEFEIEAHPAVSAPKIVSAPPRYPRRRQLAPAPIPMPAPAPRAAAPRLPSADLPEVEVLEIKHDPELDEAVIAFANADFTHSERVLVQLTGPAARATCTKTPGWCCSTCTAPPASSRASTACR